jgi:hypothetical protein
VTDVVDAEELFDRRRQSPAAARNALPVLDVLRSILPPSGLVLEVASGTGEHAVHFAKALPGLVWRPSDPSADARASVDAWAAAMGVTNMRRALDLNAADQRWPISQADAIICINMVHISPWAATEGLMHGAGALLAPGAPLYLYGPFRRAGVATARSNEAFDADLRRRDPAWGLRNLDDITDCAGRARLKLDGLVEMPANNMSLVFRRS